MLGINGLANSGEGGPDVVLAKERVLLLLGLSVLDGGDWEKSVPSLMGKDLHYEGPP